MMATKTASEQGADTRHYRVKPSKIYPNLAENIRKSDQYQITFKETNNFKINRFTPGYSYRNIRAVDVNDEVDKDEETDEKQTAFEVKSKPIDADHFLEPTMSRSM